MRSFFSFFLHRSGDPLDLPSFPTRRSSDLLTCPNGHRAIGIVIERSVWVLEGAAGKARAAVIKRAQETLADRKSTRLNSSHVAISYAVFCLKKKKEICYRVCIT